MKTITNYIAYSILRILGYFVRTLDHQEAHDFGAAVGRFGMRLMKSRQRIAVDNLAQAFPELSTDEHERIAKRVFENIGRTFTELARFPLYTPEVIDEIVTLRGAEVFKPVTERGKGCLLITPHFGNWELIAAWPQSNGLPTSCLAGRQTNRFIDELLNQLRRSVGVNIIHTGSSARKVLSALRKGELVGIVPDQHSAIGHVVVNFFGRPIAAHRGPALFAYRTDAAVVVGYLVRKEAGCHDGWVEEPIYVDRSRSEEEEVQRITQLYFSRFEEAIRQYPDMWMWTHRRWKPVPGATDLKSEENSKAPTQDS
ncbi:lysophospholipid acyltransferase family protein [bacterium AH-315-J21]|nr:lysophospholipid acyltransferase family protein [bacterium AH-315-J21]